MISKVGLLAKVTVLPLIVEKIQSMFKLKQQNRRKLVNLQLLKPIKEKIKMISKVGQLVKVTVLPLIVEKIQSMFK